MQDESKVTLREFYMLNGTHANAAEKIGCSTKQFKFWIYGQARPRFKWIQVLISRGIDIHNFPG